MGRLSSWLTLGMVAVSVAVVTLRYLFGVGWIALQELVVYLFAGVVTLSIADALRADGHVRIDVFYRDWTPRRQAWVDLLGTLLFLLPVSVFLAWASWDYVVASWSVLEGSRAAGGLPALFLIKSLIPLTAGLIFLQGLALAARSLRTLTTWRSDPRRR
jgi:TRAP-type mannitol/chloroaromatic compound transport system permease small subunit